MEGKKEWVKIEKRESVKCAAANRRVVAEGKAEKMKIL